MPKRRKARRMPRKLESTMRQKRKKEIKEKKSRRWKRRKKSRRWKRRKKSNSVKRRKRRQEERETSKEQRRRRARRKEGLAGFCVLSPGAHLELLLLLVSLALIRGATHVQADHRLPPAEALARCGNQLGPTLVTKLQRLQAQERAKRKRVGNA